MAADRVRVEDLTDVETEKVRAFARQLVDSRGEAGQPPELQGPFRPRPFPQDALPPELRELASAASAAGDYPAEFVAVPGLAVMAAAIGGRAVLELNRTFRARPIIWTATSAPPGAAKGPGQRVAIKPLERLEAKWGNQHREALARYKADRAAWEALTKKERGEEPEPPPPQRRCMVGDATIESLAPILLENPSGGILWAREELKTIVGSLDQYHNSGKGAGRSSFLELHDGQLLQVDRKGTRLEPVYVAEPRVSVTGGAVPEGFSAILRDGDGLGPRFLGAHQPGAGLALANLDKDVAQEVLDAWDALIRNMVTLPDEGVALPPIPPDQVTVVHLTSEAKRVWTITTTNFHKTWGRGETSSFGQQVIAKASLHLASLALVLHVAESPVVIPTKLSGETLTRAAELISYFIESALGLDVIEPSAAADVATRRLDDGIVKLIPWLRRRPGQRAPLGEITAARIVGHTAEETGVVVARYAEVYSGCVVAGRREGVAKGPVPVYVFAPGASTPATSATPAGDVPPNGGAEGG